MENDKRAMIFLVDDDAVFLKTLEIEFIQHGGFDIKTFTTGEFCVANLYYNPTVIILDYHLDGIDQNAMNGIETLDKIKAFNSDISVLILSSQDKIDVAINCMHHKAHDYVIKSETAFMRLQKNIASILLYTKMQKELSWYMNNM